MCHELVKKSLWRVTLLYTYSFIGSFIFCVIERKPESNRQLYSRLAQQLHQNFTTQLNISINKSDFNVFMKKAFDIVTVGNKVDWDLLSAVGFTMSSLTTIGYGHITPETPVGQMFTVVYCLVGLPICMFTLKTLGEIIAKVVNNVVLIVETRFLGKTRPKQLKTKSLCFTFMLMILTLCFGGLTQRYLEGWTFVEGIYAYFATLSTIGYGDYVPAWNLIREAKETTDIDKRINIWIIISALSLPGLAGLCVVSGVLNSLVEALEELKVQFNVRNKCSRCERRRLVKLELQRRNIKGTSRGLSQSDNKISLTCTVKERKRSATL